MKTIHYVKAPNYECVMTGSWDRTLKFWDTRSPNPMMQIALPERAYCVDVKYPMAVCGTAGRGIIIYQLENQPQVRAWVCVCVRPFVYDRSRHHHLSAEESTAALCVCVRVRACVSVSMSVILRIPLFKKKLG